MKFLNYNEWKHLQICYTVDEVLNNLDNNKICISKDEIITYIISNENVIDFIEYTSDLNEIDDEDDLYDEMCEILKDDIDEASNIELLTNYIECFEFDNTFILHNNTFYLSYYFYNIQYNNDYKKYNYIDFNTTIF